MAREKSPVFTTAKTPFKIGRAEIFHYGSDVTIVGAGPILYEAIIAAEELLKNGISVQIINCHTIKPLDAKLIIKVAKETGAIVTVEEAQVSGGLGGAIAEILALNFPTPMECIGVQNRFGESGNPSELLEGFGLTASSIILAVKRVLKRKHNLSVPLIADYISFPKKHLEKQKLQIMTEALSRAPKKWGGKKSDSSLKSRATK